jgi:hypothetical protein
MAETEDLKSFQCRFESDWGHQSKLQYRALAISASAMRPLVRHRLSSNAQLDLFDRGTGFNNLMTIRDMEAEFERAVNICNNASFEEGVDLLMNLAAEGHIPSIEQMVYIFFDQKDFNYAEDFIQYADNQEDPMILYLKARLIQETQGLNAAMSALEKAADAGNPNAVLFLVELKDGSSDDEDDEDEPLDRDGQHFRIANNFESFNSVDSKIREKLKEEDLQAFEMMSNLRAFGLLDLWVRWSISIDFQLEEFRQEGMKDQWDSLNDDIGSILKLDSKFLPHNVKRPYIFNIESGRCGVSARAPKKAASDADSESVHECDGVYCNTHSTAEECFGAKCLARVSTIGSGAGDGVYQIAAYTLEGETDSVLAFFYDSRASEELLSELIDSSEATGFLDNHLPIILGELESDGQLHFGEMHAWESGKDEVIASLEVIPDNYLVVGWLNAYDVVAKDPNESYSYNELPVSILGLYRGEHKDYFESLAKTFPVMRSLSDQLDFDEKLSY